MILESERAMPALDYERIAGLYDSYVRAETDIQFFVSECLHHKNVLELTAGTGRLSIPLLQAGIPLTCVDSSPSMLNILQGKLSSLGYSTPIHCMDMCLLDLPEKYGQIIIPFNSFSEVTDRSNQEEALRRIRLHLQPHGRLICTLHNPQIRLLPVGKGGRSFGPYPLIAGDGTLTLRTTEQLDAAESCVDGEQEFIIRNFDGSFRDRFVVRLRFFLHERAGFEKLAEICGFSVSDLFGDYNRSPFIPDQSPYMIWILE